MNGWCAIGDVTPDPDGAYDWDPPAPLQAANSAAAASALIAYVADLEILIRNAPFAFMKVP
jgi:hypothetical protein